LKGDVRDGKLSKQKKFISVDGCRDSRAYPLLIFQHTLKFTAAIPEYPVMAVFISKIRKGGKNGR